MINYKEVFQLAQDKGYSFYEHRFVLFPSTDTTTNPYKLKAEIELTLIQKWLREEHKMHVEVTYSIDHAKYSVQGRDDYHWQELKKRNPRSEGRHPYPYKTVFLENHWSKPTYEQALLEGINEALKLI